MLTYDISKAGRTHLYEYICLCIKNDIKTGRLAPGEKLPSKRELAKNLGVSLVTVETAYGQLESQGFIRTVSRSGFFVAEENGWDKYGKASGPECDPKKESRSGKTSKDKEGRAPVGESEHYFADFTGQSTEKSLFPFTTWTGMVRRVLNDGRIDLLTATPNSGAPELKQSIADYLREFRGMDVNPDNIIIGAGTEYLYGLVIQLLGTERVYSIEDPGYRKAEQICKSLKAKCVRAGMDGSGLMPGELMSNGVQVAHVTPSHQFPTGIVMPKERREELLSWAYAEKSRYIIEDDYDSELRLSGNPITPLFSLDTRGRVIYMNTFTRSLCHTMRLSFMILPTELAVQFSERLAFYSCTVSGFEQYTLNEFMRSGKYEAHLNRLRNHYRKTRDSLVKAVRSGRLGNIATVSGDEAGLHFILNIDTDVSEETIVERAKNVGIRLVPLSAYGAPGALGHKSFVMSYASVDGARALEIMDAVYECCV